MIQLLLNATIALARTSEIFTCTKKSNEKVFCLFFSEGVDGGFGNAEPLEAGASGGGFEPVGEVVGGGGISDAIAKLQLEQQQQQQDPQRGGPSSEEVLVKPPNMFRASQSSLDTMTCLRCGKTVYPTDKIGPLKDFTFFHSGCFRCIVCNTKLTLRTYQNNQHSQEDREVYCSQHVPKIGPGKFDKDSMGIKSAMNAPKSGPYVNEQIRPGGKATFDADALAIRAARVSRESQGSAPGAHAVGAASALSESAVIESSNHPNAKNWTRLDSSALHIRHALNATEVQRKYSKPHEQPIEEYLVSKKRGINITHLPFLLKGRKILSCTRSFIFQCHCGERKSGGAKGRGLGVIIARGPL